MCSLIELHQIIQEKITEGAFEKILLYIEANLGKPASPYVSELTTKNISYIYNQSVYLALFTETDALIHTAGVQLLNHSYIADDVLATHQFVSHLSDQLNPVDARANEIRSEELTVSHNEVSNLAQSSNRYTRYLFCFFSSSSAKVKPITSDRILTDKSSTSMVIG